MLFVTNTSNQKITGTIQQTLQASTDGVVAEIAARVWEDDTTLAGRWITATLDWRDGQAATSYPKISLAQLAAQYYEIDASRTLSPGTYFPVLTVRNYRQPTQNVYQVNYALIVLPPVADPNPPRYIFGPILPRDGGFPNNSQWEFNLDSDILILESSAKMLLLTARGDRVMQPDYGTNIRRILFELQVNGVDRLVQEEIVAAFAQWEPRLSLGSVDVKRDPNARSVTLNLTLVSKLNQQPFDTSIEFVR